MPWQFDLPDSGYEAAWRFLMDTAFFVAPRGPTTDGAPRSAVLRLAALLLVERQRVALRHDADAGRARQPARRLPPAVRHAGRLLPPAQDLHARPALARAAVHRRVGEPGQRIVGRRQLVTTTASTTSTRATWTWSSPASWGCGRGPTTRWRCSRSRRTRGRTSPSTAWPITGTASASSGIGTASRYHRGQGLLLFVDGRRVAERARACAASRRRSARRAPLPPVDRPVEPGRQQRRHAVPAAHRLVQRAHDPAVLRQRRRLLVRRVAGQPVDGGGLGARRATGSMLDFGIVRPVEQVKLDFLDDGPGAAVRAPARYDLQRWTGRRWVERGRPGRVPAEPEGHRANVVTFPRHRARRRLRLVLVAPARGVERPDGVRGVGARAAAAAAAHRARCTTSPTTRPAVATPRPRRPSPAGATASRR